MYNFKKNLSISCLLKSHLVCEDSIHKNNKNMGSLGGICLDSNEKNGISSFKLPFFFETIEVSGLINKMEGQHDNI